MSKSLISLAISVALLSSATPPAISQEVPRPPNYFGMTSIMVEGEPRDYRVGMVQMRHVEEACRRFTGTVQRRDLEKDSFTVKCVITLDGSTDFVEYSFDKFTNTQNGQLYFLLTKIYFSDSRSTNDDADALVNHLNLMHMKAIAPSEAKGRRR